MLIMVGATLLLVGTIGLIKYLEIREMMSFVPKPIPQVVSTIKVEALEWQPQIKTVGTLSSYLGVDVTTEVSGLVNSVKIKSGENVKKNDVLFTLNTEADLAYLQALEASADLAALVLKRDQAQLAVEGVSQAQIDTDKADLKNKRALVAQQKALVDKKIIKAPFSGRLGITAVNPGQYVNPGEKLVSLQMLDPIYIDFFVPQKQIAQVSVGQETTIMSDAFPGMIFSGKVDAINSVTDSGTRNVLVQAKLPNKKQQLLPGMFANVHLNIGQKEKLITIPQTAITYNPYGSTVFVVMPDDKKGPFPLPLNSLIVKEVFVTAGETRGDQVTITKGLEAGQEIVTTGQLKLKNGTFIKVDNSVQPKNDAHPTPQEH